MKLQVPAVTLLAGVHVAAVQRVAGALPVDVVPGRIWAPVDEQREHDVAPRLHLAPELGEAGVGLCELGHAERLSAATGHVGRHGLVGPRGEAVVALQPAQQVLGELGVVAVAQPVVPRVGGVGVGDLPGREPRLNLPPPCGAAVALEPQRRHGLERRGAQPLERLGELALPVRLERLALAPLVGSALRRRRGA